MLRSTVTAPAAHIAPDRRSHRRAWLSASALALGVALAGCSAPAPEDEGGADASAAASADSTASAAPATESETAQESSEASASAAPVSGTGDYEFDHGDQEIDVHYAQNAEDPRTARVVVVMHGTGRTADSYRDAFAEASEGENVIILAPEFDDDAYEESEDYQGGNLQEGDGDANETEDISYEVIAPMVEDFVEQIDGQQDSFSMAGHSAGGQFVHRYLAYAPDAPVDAAVAANAGWYMMPDDSVEFPYGTGDAPVDMDVEQWLASDLLVLLGEQDVEQDENLRTTPEAMAQGETRLERGRTFYRAGQEAAGDGEFGWELQTVPDAGHDKAQMAPAAMEWILSHEPS